MRHTDTLVLNWHLTEACNYRCQYCYATWNESSDRRELIHRPEQTSALLRELYQFFQPENHLNPLAKNLAWKSVRLNLAGGEPLLLGDKLISLVQQARAYGFEVSLISNGSLFNRELLTQLATELTWLGISIDSNNPDANSAIGRADRRNRLLDIPHLESHLLMARKANPSLKIKLNTVISRLNFGEDLSSLIHLFNPDKWKIMRMLPVVNSSLTVSDDEFSGFVARHGSLGGVISIEDNKDMRESYLMIDPLGRFFQNSQLIAGHGYDYSHQILDVGVEKAFSQMVFDHGKFCARYAPSIEGSV